MHNNQLDLAAHLTSHEIALAVPIGVIIAGVLTLTGVALTLRNSRQLAHDQRLWTERFRAYSDISRLCTDTMNQLSSTKPGELTEEDFKEIRNKFRNQSPGMLLIATHDIRRHFDIIGKGINAAIDLTAEQSPDTTVSMAKTLIFETCHQLINTMHVNLTSKRTSL